MSALLKPVRQFLVSEDGPTAVEYAIMVALIAVACIGAINALSGTVQNTFNGVDAAIKGS